MEQDLKALNELVEEYTNKETELMKVEQQLASRDEQFANFLTQQKRLKDYKDVLVDEIKEYMTEHGMTEHETDAVKLKLSPSGKYRLKDGVSADDIDSSLCKVVKTLENKKVTAYKELHGFLPDGVESTGSKLVIRVKERQNGF